MAESALFNAGGGKPVECPRCGRTFEGPFEVTEDDGTKRLIRGHVQGDPRLCIPIAGFVPVAAARDARARKASRRGSR